MKIDTEQQIKYILKEGDCCGIFCTSCFWRSLKPNLRCGTINECVGKARKYFLFHGMMELMK